MKKPKKIRFNPYAFARVAVMRSKLLTRHDYNKLLKMELAEITRFLAETEYRQEIEKQAIKYQGTELLEIALLKNISRTFVKLMKISDLGLRVLISKFLGHQDIKNLKTLFRAYAKGAEFAEIEQLLVDSGSLNLEEMQKAHESKEYERLLHRIPIDDIAQMKTILNEFIEDKDLFVAENKLDRLYYYDLLQYTNTLPSSSKVFKEFITTEIDILNIKNLIKFKKNDLPEEKIKELLIFSGRVLGKKKLELMSETSGLLPVLDLLEKTIYKGPIQEGRRRYDESGVLASFELELDYYMLKKARSLSTKFLLTPDGILTYLFSKETEIKNLLMIIKSKELDMDEKFIEGHILAG
ncbi:MAG: V-type ATPase subunit [Nanoarchaeota archaeon]|nr:V-type ATPase subunit [Nanoarchaeota archaeon]